MSISPSPILRAACPTCGAILNIPADYPSPIASCPICAAYVEVPKVEVPPLEIRETSSSVGLVRPRSRRSNSAEVWAICGGLIAISVAVIAYAIQVATTPTPTEPDSPSKSASKDAARVADLPPEPALRAGGEAILDGRGKDKLYLASDGAWDELAEAAPSEISHLVARGRVLCEATGARVSLVSEKNGRWKVKVVDGVNAGGEGWVKADDLRAPRQSAPSVAKSAAGRAPKVFTVNETEATPKVVIEPEAAFEKGNFDVRNPARLGARGDFDNPVSAGSGRPRMAPRPSGPNVPDPSFGDSPDMPATKDDPSRTTTPDPSAIPPRTPPGGTPK